MTDAKAQLTNVGWHTRSSHDGCVCELMAGRLCWRCVSAVLVPSYFHSTLCMLLDVCMDV